jgi:hypothetical protein
MIKKLTMARGVTLVTLAIIRSTVSAGIINTFQFIDNHTSWPTYGTNSSITLGKGPCRNIGASETFLGSNDLTTMATFLENVNNNGSGGNAVDGYWGHGLSVAGNCYYDKRVDNNGEALLFNLGLDVSALSSFFYGWGKYKTDVATFYNDNGSLDNIKASAFSGYLSLDMGKIINDQFLFVNVIVSKVMTIGL